jgi:hypothetical protein
MDGVAIAEQDISPMGEGHKVTGIVPELDMVLLIIITQDPLTEFLLDNEGYGLAICQLQRQLPTFQFMVPDNSYKNLRNWLRPLKKPGRFEIMEY